MSKPTWTAVALALVMTACATGTTSLGNGGQPDAAVQPHHDDAAHVTTDAPIVKMDAGMVQPDAFVPHDAAVDAASSLFCTDNTQCTNTGECCITLGGPQGFCGPGTVVLGACIPQ